MERCIGPMEVFIKDNGKTESSMEWVIIMLYRLNLYSRVRVKERSVSE
jgi:hypothetical protein